MWPLFLLICLVAIMMSVITFCYNVGNYYPTLCELCSSFDWLQYSRNCSHRTDVIIVPPMYSRHHNGFMMECNLEGFRVLSQKAVLVTYHLLGAADNPLMCPCFIKCIATCHACNLTIAAANENA